MIATVTLNPALDYTVWTQPLRLGEVNRTQREQVYPGGKGINVSILLQTMGIESTALGFAAGFTGHALLEMLHASGCRTDFIEIDGLTRINFKIKAEQETDINAQGPPILQGAIEALMQKLDALKQGDVLVLAGSIPDTLPADTYERILARLDGRGVAVVVDATRALLTNVLRYRPFLIKPNHHELGEIVGRRLHTLGEVADSAQELRACGARNVLVSLGKYGALLAAENGEVIRSLPPDGKTVNAVGAGDSMVAGFLAGYLRGGDFREALRVGLCAGSATAFVPWLASKEQIEALTQNFELTDFAPGEEPVI